VKCDPETTEIEHKGKPIKFLDFVESLRKRMVNQKLNSEGIENYPEGTYSFNAEGVYNFQKNELILKNVLVGGKIKDIEVGMIKSKMNFDIRVKKPKLLFTFGISGRGIYVEYESVTVETDNKFKLSMVSIPEQQKQ
ncbi:MAG: hypothetical protein GOU98_00790, partial [Candidatus Altiarchaeota archaeon]|nr:hypothetical protein [Candidatus Altiarchaeota archaeon]